MRKEKSTGGHTLPEYDKAFGSYHCRFEALTTKPEKKVAKGPLFHGQAKTTKRFG
jgi:hypothetical protein